MLFVFYSKFFDLISTSFIYIPPYKKIMDPPLVKLNFDRFLSSLNLEYISKVTDYI